MELIRQALPAIVLPPLIAVAVLLIAWRPWRRGEQGPAGAWGGALALGLAFAGAQVATLRRWPSLPPLDSTHWLVYAMIPAMALGIMDSLWRGPGGLRWGLRAALTGAFLWLLLRPTVHYTWEPGQAAVWLLGLGLATLGFWAALDALAEQLSGAALSLTLLVVTIFGSIVLLRSGFASFAQVAGGFAGALGVSLVLAWRRPAVSLARGGIPVAVVALTGLWLSGRFYAELSVPNTLLLWVAPLAGWLGQSRPVQRLRAPRAAAARLGAVLAPLLAALILTFDGGGEGEAGADYGDPASLSAPMEGAYAPRSSSAGLAPGSTVAAGIDDDPLNAGPGGEPEGAQEGDAADYSIEYQFDDAGGE